MAKGKQIAWGPIIWCAAIGLTMLAAGTFVTGPALQKRKAKKAAKKKKTGEKENNMKKAA